MEKEWINGRLGYNSQNGRYGLLFFDLWEIEGFHCGEMLEVKINDEWLQTRFEMSWDNGVGEWYLTGTNLRGTDIEYIRARIHKS